MKKILLMLALAISALAQAAGTATSGTATGGTGGSANTPKAVTLDNTVKCAGGGTRLTTGTYDPSSGAVNITVNLSGCVDKSGATHDGTVGISGAVAVSGTTVSLNNIVYNYNTHFVTATEDVQRVCTWTKNGSFDTASEKFTGTIVKTNCTLTLTDTEKGNILEHVLKLSHQIE